MLRKMTSPHSYSSYHTQRMMQEVLLALIPGIAVSCAYYGLGILVQIAMAVCFAMILEAAILKLRARPVTVSVFDGSAIVTAILLALAVPPYSPWWVMFIGILFAIGFAKHLYGGLGNNPFNPAMVGYLVLLISFPLQMTQWVSPQGLANSPSLIQTLGLIFMDGNMLEMDGLSSATVLDLLKQNDSLLTEQLYQQTAQFQGAYFAGLGVEWVNIAYLVGGLYLLYRKIITWHAPLGIILSLTIMSAVFYDGGSSNSGGSPLFHLLSGATMIGAFFIATDPVSGCTSNLGRLIFGVGIGFILYIIRVWGNYPDAMAFAVLLMNFSAPLIDYYTQPKTYGHSKRPTTKINKD